MRPEILFPLFAETTSLPGIGERMGKLFEKLAGPRLVDLCWHLPSGIMDWRFSPKVAEAPHGALASLTVTIGEHLKPRSRRLPYRILASDETGTLVLVFFHGREDWLRRTLPEGSIRIVSGRIEHFNNTVQMTHPDRIAAPGEADRRRAVEPVYPLTAGLTPRVVAKAVAAAVARAPVLPEWQDAGFLRRQGWPDWRGALAQVHEPMSEADLSPLAPARARLAFDEMLANQLALGLIRISQQRLPGRKLEGDGALRQRALAALPFALTPSQRRAIDEIAAELASGRRMLRLLQGDVGSGKTVVAFFAMLQALEAGAQAALMAPTEILARQHFATLEPMARATGVRIGILTGREKGRPRAEMLTAIADGELDIVVGTHALFQEAVGFRDLALAVIDEQHRFGVQQRLTLAAKGSDGRLAVLAMTATPIPRTLTLTAYGDMEVSRLTEKPPGRKPVDTRVVSLERLAEVVEAVERRLAAGARAFWICPLVEESETGDLAAAARRHRELTARLGPQVGLVHGRMKGPEKDQAMADFATGRTTVLVATTVVEVGVDVPEATVMVVEHAERFGLAQLHQLRGRIGRGGQSGTCILLYGPPLTEAARARLGILRGTEDGFRIAEEDLRLRGAGELLGTRQSGFETFRMADPVRHSELLAAASDDARLLLEKDPELRGPRGAALRVLLYLFERDAAVKLLRSG